MRGDTLASARVLVDHQYIAAIGQCNTNTASDYGDSWAVGRGTWAVPGTRTPLQSTEPDCTSNMSLAAALFEATVNSRSAVAAQWLCIVGRASQHCQ